MSVADVITAAFAPGAVVTPVPMRYDITTDSLVPVTQEWVDGVGRIFAKFGIVREKAKLAVNLLDQSNAAMAMVSLRAFLDAWKPEFEQKP